MKIYISEKKQFFILWKGESGRARLTQFSRIDFYTKNAPKLIKMKGFKYKKKQNVTIFFNHTNNMCAWLGPS